MAAPVKRSAKIARRLKAKPTPKKSLTPKDRDLGLFGDDEEDNLETNPMLEAISNMEARSDVEGLLISERGRPNRQNAEVARRYQETFE